MDNIQLILYIVFVVGYLIFKALTGKKKGQPDTETPHNNPQGTPRKPRRTPTFEDILKEMTGVDTGQPLPETIDKPRREAREKADEISEQVKESYQKATVEAEKVKKLDERIDLDSPAKKIALEETEELVAEDNYLSWMKNADDAKKAFVLSEIINRKY